MLSIMTRLLLPTIWKWTNIVDYNLDHLHPSVRPLASLPIDERLRICYQTKWVNYPMVNGIRNTVQSILLLPQTSQAQCILTVGEGGTGKTSLWTKTQQDMDAWARRHKRSNPSIAMRVSSDPTTNSLIEQVSEAFGFEGVAFKRNKLSPAIVRLAIERNIRFLFIDEFNHILLANRTDQRKNLAFFKELSGEPLSIALICFGTNEAVNAIQGDQQLERRFQICELNRWKESEELRAFLASYEMVLPLRKRSSLASKEIVKFLTNNTICTTREIVQRISWGAMYALLDGQEMIELEHLRSAVFLPDVTEALEID